MVTHPRPLASTGGGTAIAAMVLAALCALWTVWGLFRNLYLVVLFPEPGYDSALVVHAVFCAIELVVLGIGIGLLSLRRPAGRWLVLCGGAMVAVQSVATLVVYASLNGGFEWHARGAVTFLLIGPLMIAPAAAAAVLAALPATGRWCPRRPHPTSFPPRPAH